MKSILLALPTMGGIMKSSTAITIVDLVKVLTQSGINVDMSNMDSSDIVLARNFYANWVLEADKWDGLLFVDSDMSFSTRVVQRMLKLETDFAAAAYPKRELDLDRFAKAVRNGKSLDQARSLASNFTVKPTWDPKAAWKTRRRAGFVTMAAAGAGCSLISKAGLQAMVDAKAVTQRTDSRSQGKPRWGFYDYIEANGALLAEDYSFCYRWTEMMGRELWVCVDEEVRHIGTYNFSGRYADLFPELSQPAAAQPAEANGEAPARPEAQPQAQRSRKKAPA